MRERAESGGTAPQIGAPEVLGGISERTETGARFGWDANLRDRGGSLVETARVEVGQGRLKRVYGSIHILDRGTRLARVAFFSSPRERPQVAPRLALRWTIPYVTRHLAGVSAPCSCWHRHTYRLLA